MELNFAKYHGAGNDFILLDGRSSNIHLTQTQIERLCHRRFGIGADGLMILGNAPQEGLDFSMDFYNSDGKSGSMCGNGGRCIVKFADDIGVGGTDKTFLASDGVHTARVEENGEISLGMIDVERVLTIDEGYFLDSGSPHVVVVERYNQDAARRLRQRYDSNVNYIELEGDEIKISTFERGVEDMTWACGTGAVASAIVASIIEHRRGDVEYHLRPVGGQLSVSFTESGGKYQGIVLRGGAERTFSGVSF
ncbi:MAG: diaminopimelate epimerase [Rikenellaceae bacterium]